MPSQIANKIAHTTASRISTSFTLLHHMRWAWSLALALFCRWWPDSGVEPTSTITSSFWPLSKALPLFSIIISFTFVTCTRFSTNCQLSILVPVTQKHVIPKNQASSTTTISSKPQHGTKDPSGYLCNKQCSSGNFENGHKLISSDG